MSAYIIDAVRTPIGKYGGSLSYVRTDDLAALPVKELVKRNPDFDWSELDDVIFGDANQAGEDNRNVARMALLRAGLPVEVPGQTVNRLCGSGMQALLSCFHAIQAGEGDVFIAGGVESMSRSPFVMLKPEVGYTRGHPKTADTVLGWRFPNPAFTPEWTIGLGETAEVIAEEFKVSREAQDAFAAESQQRAERAMAAGVFADELVPVSVPQRKGDPIVFAEDEEYKNVKMEKISSLRPAFDKEGTITAANASTLNDGASALILASEEAVKRHDLKPIAKILGLADAAQAPEWFTTSPIDTIPKSFLFSMIRICLIFFSVISSINSVTEVFKSHVIRFFDII